jgi:isopenicillin-N epimerase
MAGGKGAPVTTNPIRDHYLLDPRVAYLNHGGFGAVPRPVIDRREELLREVEINPTRSYMRELEQRLSEALVPVASRLGCKVGELAWTANATSGLNLIARSLAGELEAGDEILLTDVEYGSQVTLWNWVAASCGACARVVPICGLPPEEMPQALEAAVGSRTKLAVVSHISSATALRLPIDEIGRRLRAHGVTVVVDGAHGPGHVAVELCSLDVDYYVGNLHKWFALPRGTGIVYADARAQSRLDPLVVNWCYRRDCMRMTVARSASFTGDGFSSGS